MHRSFGEADGHHSNLHLAVERDDEAAVKGILASASASAHDQLNSTSIKGWTPLFIACVKNLMSVAGLLLDAGAKQDVLDDNGWTSMEHAVFRGHLKLAKLLASHDEPQRQPPARLKPHKRHTIDYKRQSGTSQIFVYLGPSHTRSHLPPVKLDFSLLSENWKARSLTGLGVKIKSQEGPSERSYSDVKLPILENMVNQPLIILSKDPAKTILSFEVCHRPSNQDKDIEVIGTAVALIGSLREGLAPNHESLTRHFTIPLLQNGTMACIGSVTFSVLIITPFHCETSPPKPCSGFWEKSGSYPIVGHRGSGANSTARTVLQIGENTMQSFLTAIDRGVSCVEFDVQLTKDYHTVVYHDFLMKETGGDISLHELTFDQFRHLGQSQAPKTDLLSSSEQRYIERNHSNGTARREQRRHSLNEYDDSRSQDLLERIKHTDEGLQGHFKGNIRGCAIQEPSTTLEELLNSLPEHINFDLEIKYPMLWEAEDRAMQFAAIELNTYIDTILTVLFRYCGKRNITLTSFSPEVCIALVCKQRSFPILMINKAGTVPTSDTRAGSLRGAIEFATAWNLTGIVVRSDPFIMCPRLLTYAKDTGLVVSSYGELNNDPECSMHQTRDHPRTILRIYLFILVRLRNNEARRLGLRKTSKMEIGKQGPKDVFTSQDE
ncbi:MAG: hypothetical protein Q9227_002689 [Pyrenula ochraceoflavens]